MTESGPAAGSFTWTRPVSLHASEVRKPLIKTSSLVRTRALPASLILTLNALALRTTKQSSRSRSVAESTAATSAHSSKNIPYSRPCSNKVVEPELDLSAFRSRPYFPLVLLLSPAFSSCDELLHLGLPILGGQLISSTLVLSELTSCLYNSSWWLRSASICLNSLSSPIVRSSLTLVR